MTDSREDRINSAADRYKRGIITEAEFRIECEVVIFGMTLEEHTAREATMDRMIADEVAIDRADAIDILNTAEADAASVVLVEAPKGQTLEEWQEEMTELRRCREREQRAGGV